jgi:hypothetical protein
VVLAYFLRISKPTLVYFIILIHFYMNTELVFQTPFWYILLCVGLGLAASFFLYRSEKLLSSRQRYSLASLRAVSVALIAFLLLNPLIKTVKNLILKPKIVLILDHSKSVALAGKTQLKEAFSGLEALVKAIENKGFSVDIQDLANKKISTDELNENFTFTSPTTNLSSVFSSIKTSYEGQNLSDVILVSDGLFNEGTSPSHQKYAFQIHTVGIGDTTSRKDIQVSSVSANKLAYLGNKFRVGVDIKSFDYQGKQALVTIKNGAGVLLAKQIVLFRTHDDFQSISLELSADKVGKQRYLIDVQPLLGEFSTQNNHKEIIVEVVNGKEKIVLLAYAPHPDLKALKNIIEKNELFELEIQTIQSTDPSEIGKKPFDILLLHQLPDVYGSSAGIVSTLLAKQKPVMFIVGNKTNMATFNGMQSVLGINAQLNKLDKTSTQLNSSFKLFDLPPVASELLQKLPPLTIPFGEYTPSAGTDIILYQKIANVATSRPTLAVNLNGPRKAAVLVGEGLWQWRMEEYATTETTASVDDLITKTLQLISVKEDKSKLKVYPVAEVFKIDEKVTFEAEAYNAIFEKIYDQAINLKIKNEKGESKNYTFTTTQELSRFQLSNLPAGLYSYTASASILGKNESTNGEFLVSSLDLESLNGTADFNFLRAFAKENHGNFATSKTIFDLRNNFDKKNRVDKIVSSEEMKDFVNLQWFLGLIILLLGLEWVLRKYLGSF